MGALFMAGLVQGGFGCSSGDDDDDDGDDGGDAGILVAITYECPPDAEDVEITATPAGTSDSLSPNVEPCAQGGVNIQLDAGDWDIDILPTGGIGDFLGQTDTVGGVDGERIPIDFVFPDNGGFFLVSWTIEGLAAPDGCNAGERVEVTATLLDDPSVPLIDDFPCEDGEGVAGQLDPEGWPLGEYVLDIALIDENDEAISVPDPVSGVFIDFADQLSDIGTQDIIPE